MNFKEDVLPHLIAVIVFALITIVFYNPVFFENKRLAQHDVEQGIGGGKELIDFREKTGEEGLWTNSMFSGMPAYLINTQWSGDLLGYIQQFLSLGLKAPARYVFWAMISFYILLLSFGVRPYLSIAGAVAYGMSSFIIIGISAGHVWRIVGMAWMPLVIAGIHSTFNDRRWLGLALTSLGLALQIRSNHLQMTYYLMIMILVYGLYMFLKAIREKTLRQFTINLVLLMIPVILAIGSNFGKIWTILEYSKYSIRGTSELSDQRSNQAGLERDYAFQYSNSIFEPLTILIPNIMGGATQQELDRSSHLAKVLERNGMPGKQIEDQLRAVPTYWGKLPVTAPYYAGVLVFFLFVLSIFITDKDIRNWGITIFILSILLSWGSNFQLLNYFLFDHLPGYNKFRSVTFTITMAFIILPLLGFIGLETFFRQVGKLQIRKHITYAVYITGSILLLALLYSWLGSFSGAIDERLGNLPDWYIHALRNDRARLLRLDVLRGMIFLSLFILVIWRLWIGKFNLNVAYVSIILLVTLDISLVSSRYMSENSYVRNARNEILQPSAADQRIRQDKGINYRVLNLQNPFNEARTSYFHHSIGGYHGAKIRRYQDIIEHHLGTEINRFIENYQKGPVAFRDLQVLNMLNAKYFYAGSDAQGVFPNPYAFGNAWFVKDIIQVSSPDEEIALLGEIDLDSTCVMDNSKFRSDNINFQVSGSIQLLEYQPNYLRYESDNDYMGLGVFSEMYYPEGWSASINGEQVEIKRVNYILRALEIPAGRNSIEFKFEPGSYYVGNKITLAGSLLTLLFMAGCVWLERKTRPIK